MSIDQFANRFVCDLVAYEPGKPIDETARELGLNPADIVKVASNENPLGPSPLAKEAMRAALEEAHIYPDGGGYRLRNGIATTFDLPIDQVIIGNGSNEIIELLCHSFLNPEAELIAAEHAFVVYKLMATLFGARYVEVPDPGFAHDLDAMADAITERTRLVFIANPNNPTGTMVGQEAIDRFMARVPEHVVVVFDEAYYEFVKNPPDTLKYVREGRNVCVLRTFSKIHGLAAQRVGWAVAPLAIIAALDRVRGPFNVTSTGQAAAVASLGDDAHIAMVRAETIRLRGWLAGEIAALGNAGLRAIPSACNFLLVEFPEDGPVTAAAANQHLLESGIICRYLAVQDMPRCLRISIGTEAETKAVAAALRAFVGSAA
jgi:histidinol-phosphate aminotransferase